LDKLTTNQVETT